jgi:hypothetical protein
VDEDRHGWQEDGGEFPLWVGWVIAFGFAVVCVGLLVLWVDLRHQAALYDSRPDQIVTPHTYGPPPAR